MPAEAGIQKVLEKHWIPAFAGMTRLVTYELIQSFLNPPPK